MANYVVKPGTILGYSVRRDVIYICYSVPCESFTGLFTSQNAFRFPSDDMKLIVKAIQDNNYVLDVLFIGNVIKDVRFKYVPKNNSKEVSYGSSRSNDVG